MSKSTKLGGVRLRLIMGLTAAMAISAGVLSMSAQSLSLLFNPDSVVQTQVALLEIRDATPGTYYLVPLERDADGDNYEGWSTTEDGSGSAFNDPIGFHETEFDENPADNFCTITIDGSGDKDVYILTDTVDEEDDEYFGDAEKETRVEMRSGSPTGSLVGYADIEVLQQ